TIAPIALWIKRSRRSNLADSDASRELDQSRPPRWVAWLAIAMLAVGVALAIGTSAAATVILLPWIRHGAGQIGTIAAPLIFLICLLATFTALAAAAHVAIWAVKQLLRMLVAVGRWQSGVESRAIAGIAGAVWLLAAVWSVATCIDPHAGWAA